MKHQIINLLNLQTDSHKMLQSFSWIRDINKKPIHTWYVSSDIPYQPLPCPFLLSEKSLRQRLACRLLIWQITYRKGECRTRQVTQRRKKSQCKNVLVAAMGEWLLHHQGSSELLYGMCLRTNRDEGKKHLSITVSWLLMALRSLAFHTLELHIHLYRTHFTGIPWYRVRRTSDQERRGLQHRPRWGIVWFLLCQNDFEMVHRSV